MPDSVTLYKMLSFKVVTWHASAATNKVSGAEPAAPLHGIHWAEHQADCLKPQPFNFNSLEILTFSVFTPLPVNINPDESFLSSPQGKIPRTRPRPINAGSTYLEAPFLVRNIAARIKANHHSKSKGFRQRVFYSDRIRACEGRNPARLSRCQPCRSSSGFAGVFSEFES